MDALNPQNDLTNPPPPAGHNQPDNINSVLADEAVDKEIKTADAWVGVTAIATAEQAKRLQDAIDRLNEIWDKYEAERKAEKKPHDDRALAVQKRWRPILHKVEVCLEALNPLRADWLDREGKRIERERREAQERANRAAQEADAAMLKAQQAITTNKSPVSAKLAAEQADERAKQAEQAVFAIPDRARVKGSYGRPARSLREYWSAEVVDVLKAARYYRERLELRECLASLASAEARAGVRNTPEGQGIPGCNIISRKE